MREFHSRVFIKVYYRVGMWEEDRRQRFMQSYLTLCNPRDCCLPGSSVHGLLQARIWSRLPFPFSGDLPKPWIEPESPTLQADSLLSEPPGKPWNVRMIIYWWLCHFNAAAWMRVTEPWRMCWAFVWRGSVPENFLSLVSRLPLPHFFEFPHPRAKHFWLLTCWFQYLMQIILCICPHFTNQFYWGQKL